MSLKRQRIKSAEDFQKIDKSRLDAWHQRPRFGRILPPGLLIKDRPYADWHFKSGYGYWQYRGGFVICFLRGHRWKWCHSLIRLDDPKGAAPYWHVQCTRCMKSEENPSEDDNYRKSERELLNPTDPRKAAKG